MTRKTLNKFAGSPSFFGTGYKPYYPINSNGQFGKAPTRDLDLKKLQLLDLDHNEVDGIRRLKALDCENNRITYSPLGSIVAASMNKEDEASNLEFDKINNYISLDFISARGIPGAYDLIAIPDLKESQRELIKFLLEHKMITIKAEDDELAEDMGLLESTWSSENE